MSINEEVRINIKAIWKISIYAKKCYRYAYSLYKPQNDEELKYLHYSREFQFIGQVLWRNTVIELSKLFSESHKRDKFNIIHFIKKLHKNQYYGKCGIDQSKIDDWTNRIEISRSTIDSIIKLRDKVYAHTDNEVIIDQIEIPTFEQTGELLIIVDSLIQEIYASVFDGHALLETSMVTENLSDVLKALVTEKNSRIQAYEDLIKRNIENRS